MADVLRDYTGKASDALAVDTARPLAGLMADLNTDQMFQRGQDGGGLPIQPGYTEYTRQIKAAKGQPTNRVTLRDTGDFHQSVRAEFQGDKIEMVATDPKTARLQAKYGEDILGLDGASLNTVRDKLRPLLIDRLRNDLANA